MVGALIVHAFLYQLIRKREKPIFSVKWNIPAKKDFTPSLFNGSTLFGIGWGLAGYCTAPAITSIVTFDPMPFAFTISIIIGMTAYGFFLKIRKER